MNKSAMQFGIIMGANFLIGVSNDLYHAVTKSDAYDADHIYLSTSRVFGYAIVTSAAMWILHKATDNAHVLQDQMHEVLGLQNVQYTTEEQLDVAGYTSYPVCQ